MPKFLNGITYIDSNGVTRTLDSSAEFRSLLVGTSSDFHTDMTPKNFVSGKGNSLESTANADVKYNYLFGENLLVSAEYSSTDTTSATDSIEGNFVTGNENHIYAQNNNVVFGYDQQLIRSGNKSFSDVGANFIAGHGNKCIESKNCVISGGWNTCSSTENAYVFGMSNKVYSDNVFVQGYGHIVNPDSSYSTVFGCVNVLNGHKYANLFGDKLHSTADNQTIVGVLNNYNISNANNIAFCVGTGTSSNDRKNSLVVLKNGPTLVNPPTSSSDSNSAATKGMFENNVAFLYALIQSSSNLSELTGYQSKTLNYDESGSNTLTTKYLIVNKDPNKDKGIFKIRGNNDFRYANIETYPNTVVLYEITASIQYDRGVLLYTCDIGYKVIDGSGLINTYALSWTQSSPNMTFGIEKVTSSTNPAVTYYTSVT